MFEAQREALARFWSYLMNDTPAQQAIAEQIYDYFVGQGFKDFEACGIIGGGPDRESSFRVNVKGDNGTAWGLFQLHDSPPEYDRVTPILKATGIDMRTAGVIDQCKGVWWELHATERNTLQRLLVAKDAADAGRIWTHYYERPGAKGQDDKGADNAVKWLAYFQTQAVI